jgi:hypothetical protein
MSRYADAGDPCSRHDLSAKETWAEAESGSL